MTMIVGELINASRKAMKTAIEDQDSKIIRKVAQDQVVLPAPQY
jgi:hypothetical protein